MLFFIITFRHLFCKHRENLVVVLVITAVILIPCLTLVNFYVMEQLYAQLCNTCNIHEKITRF